MPHMIHMSAQTAGMYAALGSELEHTLDNRWRMAFSRAAAQIVTEANVSDSLAPLQFLGWFAQSKASAVCERLAGRIQQAQIYEDRADAYYTDLPTHCRW